MKLPSYQFLAQMSAAFAVVVSLGFVAYELKQARDIALAEIYQDKTALRMNLNMALIGHPPLLDSVTKMWASPHKLDINDVRILGSYLGAEFAYFENNHFLYQQGMITEEQMNTIRANIAGILNASEFFRHWWITSSESGAWRTSFEAEVNEILNGLGSVEPRDPQEIADWVTKKRCLASGDCQAR